MNTSEEGAPTLPGEDSEDAVTIKPVRAVDPQADAATVFWDGCARREFWLQHCTTCDAWQFYPRSLCSHCWAPTSALEWRRPGGGAVVESFSVVHRGSGAFAAHAPYVVALVRFDEGPVMMSHIVGLDIDLGCGVGAVGDVTGIGAVAIGDRVELEFAELAGRTVPVFRAVGTGVG
ncbi:hypothetical protein GCM10023350_28770 [Nocardioides endophyticus]|uniref:Zn-ribbon domain-containing OB-fold protein n=1 Tax=Nocardioides endophyticus TaxID=1353775 RepID=A0ABP8YZM0_9ACTN